MYKFHNKFRRIDWIYKNYANLKEISTKDFLDYINEAYYKHSANLYSIRYTKDIENCYKKMFNFLNINSKEPKKHIVDIGAGTGFEYKIIKKLKIPFSNYDFVEPSLHMVNKFKDYLKSYSDEKVCVHNCEVFDIAPKLLNKKDKIFIINSALHHVVYVEDFLGCIKENMQPNDLLILGHEPNNDNKLNFFMRPLHFILKAFFTKSLLIRIPIIKNFFHEEIKNKDRWENINNELIDKKIILQEMPILAIRRMIDYGVGYKNDMKTLSIPNEYNEGYLGIKDVGLFLGEDFELQFYKTYRHFGDSDGNIIIESLNKLFYWCLKDYGTNYIAAWKKK